MIHESYETRLVDGAGEAVALADGQTWQVTKTEVQIQERGGERFIVTIHYVIEKAGQ